MLWSRIFSNLTTNFNIRRRQRGRHFATKKHYVPTPKAAPSPKTVTPSTSDATLLIIYKDEAHQALADPELVAGQLGAKFNLRFKNFKHYRLVKIQGFTSTFVDSYGIITLTYQRITAANIWVFCIDLDSRRFLTKPHFVNGLLGQPYALASPTIKNYRLLLAKGPIRGTFSDKQAVVTYYYRNNNIQDITYQPYFLEMLDFITCYDNPLGHLTSVTLAKGTVWKTFQTILLTDGQIWHCMGGSLWIKETATAFKKITGPTKKSALNYQAAIKLPYSQPINQLATINFVPHKQVTSYERPFGRPSQQFTHNQQVLITATLQSYNITWYQLNHTSWITSQYLKISAKKGN